MTESDFEKYVFHKLNEFAEMFGSKELSYGENGVESKSNISKPWQDVVLQTINAAIKGKSGIRTTNKLTYNILCSYWKGTERFTIDSKEFADICEILDDKIRILHQKGMLSKDTENFGLMIANDAMSCEVFTICELVDGDNNAIDRLMMFRKQDVIEIFMSVLSEITEDKTELYNFDYFIGDAKFLYNASVLVNPYASALLKGMFDVLCSSENKKRQFDTYLAIDDTNLIKIGRSSDFFKRLRAMSIGNPTIKMLAVFDGDSEKRWHNRFESKNKKGEWFRLSKSDIKDLIKNNKVVWKNPAFDNMIKDLI